MSELGMAPNLIGVGVERYRESGGANLDASVEKLSSVGKDFESVFLSLMLKEMRNTLESGGFFGEESSDSYGGMFDMFIGQHLAKSAPLGINKMVLEAYAGNSPGPEASSDTGNDSDETKAQNVSIRI